MIIAVIRDPGQKLMALLELVTGILSEVAKSIGTKVVTDKVDDRRDRKAALFLQIMRLHDDLRRCHENFQLYKSRQQHSDSRYRWWETVQALQASLASLGTTLEIYSPELSRELREYYDTESAMMDLRIDLGERDGTDNIKSALTLMREFIKDNFTPEDFNYYYAKHYGK